MMIDVCSDASGEEAVFAAQHKRRVDTQLQYSIDYWTSCSAAPGRLILV